MILRCSSLATITVALLFSQITLTYAQSPHLSGHAEISLAHGFLKCDFKLSGIPRINDYFIRLNAGFNISHILDSANQKTFRLSRDEATSGEAFEYYIPHKDGTKALPSTLLFSYTGAFPVRDSTNSFLFPDWKGNITVDKTTFRAAESAAWYPQLYDVGKDQLLDSYTYDITVHCTDCKSVYINGSLPQRGITTHFVSREPRALLLFAGNFDFQEVNKTIFINADLKPEHTKLLNEGTIDVIAWYERKLSVPYGSRIAYLVSYHNKRNNAWAFVTFPTIAVIGNKRWSIDNFFIEKPLPSLDSSSVHTIAHEVGHYYFGTQLRPNDSLRWTFLEGTTEYMALQYGRQKFGKKFYENTLQEYLKSIKDFALPITLSRARDTDLGSVYWYNYVPLLFTVLEGNIGEKKMWRWLSHVVKEKNAITNYGYLRSSLLASGVTEAEFTSFESTYILNENAQKSVVEYFKSKMKSGS